jgi:hypothetical protein
MTTSNVRRLALVMALVVAGASPSIAKKKKPLPPPCLTGTYAPTRALTTGETTPNASPITVGDGAIGIAGVCGPIQAKKLKATKKGTKVLAAWASCHDGVREISKAKLKALIKPDCQQMSGVLTGRRKGPDDRKPKKFRTGFTASLVATTTTMPRASFVHWSTPPPAQVADGQVFPLELEFTTEGRGCTTPGDAAAQGTLVACPADVPVQDCDDVQPFDLTPAFGSYEGPPGRFPSSAIRRGGCGPEPYYFATQFRLRDTSGQYSVGPFYGPDAPLTLLASAAGTFFNDCDPDAGSAPPALAFHALLGASAPPAQTIYVGAPCTASAWSATTSAPWVHVTPSGGADASCQDITVSVDPTGLSASPIPYAATVTIASPGVATPFVIPISLTVVGGVSATVTTAPPATVVPGQSFSLGIALAAGSLDLAGDLIACPAGASFDECELYPFYSDDSSVYGTGSYTFALERGIQDCAGGAPYTFAIAFYVYDDLGESVGPFYLPLAATTTLTTAAPQVEIVDDALVLGARPGEISSAQSLYFYESCDAPLAWTASASQPWVILTPTSGTFPNDVTEVSGNATGLAPGIHTATVTIAPVGYPGAARTVEVTFHVRNDVALSWIVPAPATVTRGQELTLRLQVSANASSLYGTIGACPVGIPVEDCVGSSVLEFPDGNDFSGPPGTFDVRVKRGLDCAEGQIQLVAFVWVAVGFDDVGPFGGPPTVTSLAGDTAAYLDAAGAPEFHAFGTTNPLPQTVHVFGSCGAVIASPTATSNVAWAHPTLSSSGSGLELQIAIDVTGLDWRQGPLQGEITVSSPGAADVKVPVVLHLAC